MKKSKFERRRRKKTAAAKAAVLMLLLLLTVLSGCSFLFTKDYLVINDHEDDYNELLPDASIQIVSNYTAMKNAVLNLVGNVSEQGTIRTKNYLGDVPNDISKACYEVTIETPLGAYAVDYIAHDPTSYLCYYVIGISITYKRTKEEINSIIRVNSGPALNEQLDTAIREFKRSIALLQVSTKIDKETIIRHVAGYYRSNPSFVYAHPNMTINLYPDNETVQKIIEIELDYSLQPEEIERRLYAINAAAAYTVFEYRELTEDIAALRLCEALIGNTEPMSAEEGMEVRTAYGALITYKATSEGYAMAYKLLCDKAAIECQVIEGRLNSEKHYWNIIRIGEDYYHVDAFVSDLQGLDAAFLKKDSDMWGKYWWDTENYFECAGNLTYGDILAALNPIQESAEPLPEQDQ